MVFELYIRSKEKDGMKSQKLKLHFNRIKDALHYAIDQFDLKSDVGMTICKGGKTVMVFSKDVEK